MTNSAWPALPWTSWSDTADTLHMWTQIVGKTRLVLTPVQNHWWNVPLYLTARGLTTSTMPCGDDVLDIEFDFVKHALHVRLGSGREQSMDLVPKSVAEFYHEYQECLASLGVAVKIWPMPVEVQNPIRFDLDSQHKSYDPEYAHRFWQVLLRAQHVFRLWTSRFMGKVSPVHFFWGSFDLAVTRFSGRPAPPREGADRVQQEAYCREVISAGFWPGNGGYGSAAFYCYAAPVPTGLSEKMVRPPVAAWDTTLGEYIFKYDDLLRESSPQEVLLEFLDSAYAAAADAANWDRSLLDRK